MTKFSHLAILCLGLAAAGCDNVNTEPPDMQSMHETRPLGETKELNVDLKYAVGSLEISKIADENLFSIDLQYDRRRYNPQFRFEEGDHASVHLDMNGQAGIGGKGARENELTVRLTDKVPLSLDVTTGVAESHLEMSSLQVRRLHLRLAAVDRPDAHAGEGGQEGEQDVPALRQKDRGTGDRSGGAPGL